MKVSRPRLTFLSCAISAISASASARPFLGKSGDILQMGRQADFGKVTFYARRIRFGDHSELRGKFRGQHHADGNAFAMEQPVGETGRGLQRMPERMAEIEQRAFAVFAFVARHDRGLGAAGGGDGVLARRAALENIGVVGLQPGEERFIAEHAIFGDFGIAGAELARRQRVEHRGVGDHQHRLVKRAEQILALRRIDPGLAADGRIDLRQQRGRHLHEIDAAAQDRRRKAGEIADHAAAERNHQIVALDPGRDQRLRDLGETGIGFRAFALVDHDVRRSDAGLRQRGLGLRQPVFCDRAIRHDGGARAGPQRGDAPAKGLQHIAADDDVIGAVAERDVDDDGIGMLQRRGHVALNALEVCLDPSPHNQACKASRHSSTIRSCGTSRDQIVRSAR